LVGKWHATVGRHDKYASAIEKVGLYTDSQLVLSGDDASKVLRGQRVSAGFSTRRAASVDPASIL
jgi:hypothetical protein